MCAAVGVSFTRLGGTFERGALQEQRVDGIICPIRFKIEPDSLTNALRFDMHDQ